MGFIEKIRDVRAAYNVVHREKVAGMYDRREKISLMNRMLKGEEILNELSYESSGRTIGYDKSTGEIMISEQMLMYFIRLANPMQKDRPIILVSSDELRQRKLRN